MTKKELIDLAIEKLGPLFKPTDDTVISNIGETVILEALDLANMKDISESLDLLRSIIIETIIIAYENRGSESLKSQSALGQSDSFIDWNEYLQTNITKKGKRYVR